MKTTANQLSNERLQDIYTNDQFRNEVASAHTCRSAKGEDLGFKTCSHPINYKVTEEQIKEAKKEQAKAKKEAIENVKNKLVFVAMGSSYEPRYKDDVCNHRIRTSFLNAEGKKYFIEFGRGRENEIRIDHAIDKDLQNHYNIKLDKVRDEIQKRGGFNAVPRTGILMSDYTKYQGQPYYNFRGLERMPITEAYTLQNLLTIVNENFNCNFKDIEVDNYNLSSDDFVCKSPKL